MYFIDDYASRKEKYRRAVRKFRLLSDRERKEIYDLVLERFPYYAEHLGVQNLDIQQVLGATDSFTESYLFGLMVDVAGKSSKLGDEGMPSLKQTMRLSNGALSSYGKDAYFYAAAKDPDYEIGGSYEQCG